VGGWVRGNSRRQGRWVVGLGTGFVLPCLCVERAILSTHTKICFPLGDGACNALLEASSPTIVKAVPRRLLDTDRCFVCLGGGCCCEGDWVGGLRGKEEILAQW